MASVKRIKRNINGVLLLNKDAGRSSNVALQKVKYLLQAAKAGHTGSLDPLASGVLPVCLGEATKFSRFLLEADKTYQVTAKLGAVTSTGDLEGEIIAEYPVPNFSEKQIQAAVQTFIGDIQQVPTMFSALKHKGQPLYKLARQGITIERPARDIHVYDFTLLNQTADTLTFSIKCSKGTYIRTLIEDLGTKLGCGAHVTFLHRTQVGPFTLQHSYRLDQLQTMADPTHVILPLDCLLTDLPKVVLSIEDAKYLQQGRVLASPPGAIQGLVAVADPDQVLVGVAEAMQDGSLVPRRLLSSSL